MKKYGLFLLPVIFIGIALRLPYLFQIPAMTESNETIISLEIVNLGITPLTNQNPHIGAFFNYLIALFLLFFGNHYWVPRAVMLVIAAGTIVLTFLLGKEIAGSRSGLISSFLISVSMYHIYRNSHFAWSNCSSPFFYLLTVFLFVKFITSERGILLILTGFLFGISLQTHPSAIVLLPPLLIWIIFIKGKVRALLKNKFFYLAFFGFAVGYSNMIYFNLQTRFSTYRHAITYPKYAVVDKLTIPVFLENLKNMLILLLRLLTGNFYERPFLEYLINPSYISLIILLFAGVLVAVKRKIHLPFLIPLTTCIIFPMINKAYDFKELARYQVFLFPFLYLLVSLPFEDFSLPNRLNRLNKRNFLYFSGAILLFYSLVFTPLINLHSYYRSELISGETSQPFFDLLKIIRKYQREELGQQNEKGNILVLFDPMAYQFVAAKDFLRLDGIPADMVQDFWVPRAESRLDYHQIRAKIYRLQKQFLGVRLIVVLSPENCRQFVKTFGITQNIGLVIRQIQGFPWELYYLYKIPENVDTINFQ